MNARIPSSETALSIRVSAIIREEMETAKSAAPSTSIDTGFVRFSS